MFILFQSGRIASKCNVCNGRNALLHYCIMIIIILLYDVNCRDRTRFCVIWKILCFLYSSAINFKKLVSRKFFNVILLCFEGLGDNVDQFKYQEPNVSRYIGYIICTTYTRYNNIDTSWTQRNIYRTFSKYSYYKE